MWSAQTSGAHLEGQLSVLDLLHVAADRGVRDDVLAQVQLVQHRGLPGIVQPCRVARFSVAIRMHREHDTRCHMPHRPAAVLVDSSIVAL